MQSWWFELCLKMLRRGRRNGDNIYSLVKPKHLEKSQQVFVPSLSVPLRWTFSCWTFIDLTEPDKVPRVLRLSDHGMAKCGVEWRLLRISVFSE